ncbi:MAG: hypothetical protein CL581_11075 [Alteromonadaceae bacterium]|nr:hypothetical protein [Alteromonadaceae bacterium]MAA65305.1 hypothetical protein [Alteromonadaceae bacterium]|tara:strand:+ start:142 stop:459 length:318 start_codon:yes stop_codon:yes gene_type:complete
MRWILLAVVAACLTSCGMLDLQQQEAAVAVADQLLVSGVISQEQWEGLVETIQSQVTPGFDWRMLIETVAAGLLAYFGVRVAPPRRRIQNEVVSMLAAQKNLKGE